ncbi:MAG: hypothetical protein GY810_13890 [Aureispira sp.]|nr:hypothetical protein [Aureispira sp.]
MFGPIILIAVIVLGILIMGMRINVKVPPSSHNDHDNELQELNDIREYPMKDNRSMRANFNNDDYIL